MWTVAPQPGERGGGKKRVQRYIEAESTGERWGEIGDSSGGGRNGRNDPENDRRNFGAEGRDKSVIDKRQSLKIEQSLSESR